MKNIIITENVRRLYGMSNQVAALDGISLSIKKGDFVAIMGPSGSGKTTLLNVLAGLDTPTSGTITINDHVLTKYSKDALAHFRRTELGFVFQDYNLLDSLTLGENIALPLLLNKRLASVSVRTTMDLLGIKHLENRFPYEVSGGQQQRAAVARALVHKPSLILADEPSGNLDSKAATDLLKTFRHINQMLQVTIVMVTHDPYSASYANKVIFIRDGVIHSKIHASTEKHFYDEILNSLKALESGK